MVDTVEQRLRRAPDGAAVERGTDTFPRRRWSDGVADVPLTSLARFLAASPPMDDVLRYVVAMLAFPTGATGGLFVRSDGNDLLEFAHFLPHLEHDPTHPCVLEALEQLRTALVHDTSSLTFSWPLESSPIPLHAYAIRVGGQPDRTNLLILMLAVPVQPEFARHHVMHIVDLLTVYLAANPSPSATPNGSAEAGTFPPQLSARQRTVLQLMAAGMTLRQIANRIGYSESTVRMESLAIYRMLGVHDRDKAVLSGRAYGFLADGEAPARDVLV